MSNSSDRDVIRKFAEQLVKLVRDDAIRNADTCLPAESTSVIAQRWRASGYDERHRKMLEVVISDVVDATVHSLLHSVDSGQLHLLYCYNNKVVDLHTDGMGEMAGSYMGDDWRCAYSNERYYESI